MSVQASRISFGYSYRTLGRRFRVCVHDPDQRTPNKWTPFPMRLLPVELRASSCGFVILCLAGAVRCGERVLATFPAGHFASDQFARIPTPGRSLIHSRPLTPTPIRSLSSILKRSAPHAPCVASRYEPLLTFAEACAAFNLKLYVLRAAYMLLLTRAPPVAGTSQ